MRRVRYARDRHTLCKKLEAPPVPTPYTPPLARRAQAVKSGRFRNRLAAVESAGRRIPPRWRWLVPLIGLVPILVAVVLASEGIRLGGPSGQPVTSGALATSTAVAGRPAAVAGVPQGPTPIAGQAGTNTTTGQPSAAQPGGPNGAQTIAGQPSAGAGQTVAGAGQTGTTTATRAADGSAQSQGAGATSSGSSTIAGGATASGASTAGRGNSIAATTGPFRAYAVQPGDTVKFVAQMYGVSPASISQASGLQNPDLLRVGQVLTIPAQPGWLYRVQAGESLDQIAARTGVSTAIIASASNLAADSVRAGDVILIPDRASAVTK